LEFRETDWETDWLRLTGKLTDSGCNSLIRRVHLTALVLSSYLRDFHSIQRAALSALERCSEQGGAVALVEQISSDEGIVRPISAIPLQILDL
jgi:hypothetical protein